MSASMFESLKLIMENSLIFGGGVFYLAATMLSSILHRDPTSFTKLDDAGLPQVTKLDVCVFYCI